jgi:hypothetical protein
MLAKIEEHEKHDDRAGGKRRVPERRKLMIAVRR